MTPLQQLMDKVLEQRQYDLINRIELGEYEITKEEYSILRKCRLSIMSDNETPYIGKLFGYKLVVK